MMIGLALRLAILAKVEAQYIYVSQEVQKIRLVGNQRVNLYQGHVLFEASPIN